VEIPHANCPLLPITCRLAGYEDTNDAERLAVDPAMRHVIGGRAKERNAASTSQMSRFETTVLTQAENLEALMELSGKRIDRLRQRKPIREIVLDMDSSVSETYGQQEGSAYNGRFRCTCHYPLAIYDTKKEGRKHETKDDDHPLQSRRSRSFVDDKRC
jgi:hypothetical protein